MENQKKSDEASLQNRI